MRACVAGGGSATCQQCMMALDFRAARLDSTSADNESTNGDTPR